MQMELKSLVHPLIWIVVYGEDVGSQASLLPSHSSTSLAAKPVCPQSSCQIQQADEGKERNQVS
jgi:hypothetical protein